jgi:cell division septum initiation protein DivIVA
MDAGETSWKPSGSADSIPPPSFGTVRHGYDPAQVLEYLKRLTDHLLGLESEVRRLQDELGAPDPAPMAPAAEPAITGQDPYESVGARVADLVRAFDQDVERLRRDVEVEASKVVAEARVEADRIREDAQKVRRDAEGDAEVLLAQARSEADRIRLDTQAGAEEARVQAAAAFRDAQREADKVLSGLGSRREALLAEMRMIRDRMVSTLGELEATLQEAAPAGDVVIVEPAEAS